MLVSSTMPATRRKRAAATSRTGNHNHNSETRDSTRFTTTDPTSWDVATVSQLHYLSVKTLHLHLSAKNLVTTGNKSVMAQRLFDAIQSANAPPSQSHTGSSKSQPSLPPTANSQPTATDVRNATSPRILPRAKHFTSTPR